MLLFAVPAYNEEGAIGALLDNIDAAMRAEHFEYRVLVVDDGSTDDTAAEIADRARRYPVTLVPHERNMGLAAAMRTCLTTAVAEAADDDIIVTMDGDNTHLPGLIPRMVRSIREGRDIIIASRYQPGARVLGLVGFRQFMSWGAGVLFRITFPIPGVRDYTCGYRAYRAAVVREAIRLWGDNLITEQGFACQVELLLRFARLNVIMDEVPMILRYDQKVGASKMNVRRTVAQTLRLLARERVGFGPRRHTDE
ncbi:MAG: glycosyltransferase family 2 protein [candidate division WS1 bacterium]|jgi:dolichol-phosphate mannosyltransferase|nr:glycosyltransferase family 2 protein [candidate division WS1 bacterium]